MEKQTKLNQEAEKYADEQEPYDAPYDAPYERLAAIRAFEAGAEWMRKICTEFTLELSGFVKDENPAYSHKLELLSKLLARIGDGSAVDDEQPQPEAPQGDSHG